MSTIKTLYVTDAVLTAMCPVPEEEGRVDRKELSLVVFSDSLCGVRIPQLSTLKEKSGVYMLTPDAARATVKSAWAPKKVLRRDRGGADPRTYGLAMVRVQPHRPPHLFGFEACLVVEGIDGCPIKVDNGVYEIELAGHALHHCGFGENAKFKPVEETKRDTAIGFLGAGCPENIAKLTHIQADDGGLPWPPK